MLDKIKYPYFNMQSLNLDWLMDRIANMPEIVQVPALAGTNLSDVEDMLDMKALEIPKTLSFVKCGVHDDPMERQCLVILFKIDNDNMAGLCFGFTPDISFQAIYKEGGSW